MRLCECGCGKEVVKETNRYLYGHSGGGSWQLKYNKESEEYKKIVSKISKSVSTVTKGVKKSDSHIKNISAGRKRWIKENPKYFNNIMDKMRETKKQQSQNGILSKNHYVNTRNKTEVDDIYNKIVSKSNETKNIKKMLGIYPDIWNKNKSRFNDERIRKWSGENHYLWNPNKNDRYGDEFYNKEFREHLLERQKNGCLLCAINNDLCLHHIDKDKRNNNENNLIYLCRSCHSKVHNNFEKMTKQVEEMLYGIFNQHHHGCGGDKVVSSQIAMSG